MHDADSVSLPDVDRGLHVVLWKASGFRQMRNLELLDPKARFELVDGLVLHRDPRSERHDRVVAEVARRLADDGSWEVRIGEELWLDKFDAVVAPDIVVAGEREPARLIVEVSDGAPRLEAQEKPRLYAKAGVEEYWHIDLAWRFIQVHASPFSDGYGMRGSGPSNLPTRTRFPGLPEIKLDELLGAADASA